MQKILKYTFSLNHKVEISNLPERVLDLTQKLSEWVPLQRFLHRQLGVWLYLKPGVVTEVWLSDQIRSAAQSCPTLCNPMNHSTPGLPVHHQLPESTQTHVHWVGDAIPQSHPLSSPSPPALNLSQHQGLFHESALHIRWPKYCSFSFNISSSKEHPGLISFRMDWFYLLAVQRHPGFYSCLNQ